MRFALVLVIELVLTCAWCTDAPACLRPWLAIANVANTHGGRALAYSSLPPLSPRPTSRDDLLESSDLEEREEDSPDAEASVLDLLSSPGLHQIRFDGSRVTLHRQRTVPLLGRTCSRLRC
jgi:hypothetical protein